MLGFTEPSCQRAVETHPTAFKILSHRQQISNVSYNFPFKEDIRILEIMEMYLNCKSTAQQGKQKILAAAKRLIPLHRCFLCFLWLMTKKKKKSFPNKEVFLRPFFSKNDMHKEEIRQGRHEISANFIWFKLSHKKKQMADELLLL